MDSMIVTAYDSKYDGPDVITHQQRPVIITLTIEETEMARMTYDGLLLQSQLAFEEVRSLDDIAQDIFTREGEEAGKVAKSRALRAAMNLITMKQATAVPNKKEITHVRSTASSGTQLAALMNINIQRAVQGRSEDRRITELAAVDSD